MQLEINVQYDFFWKEFAGVERDVFGFPPPLFQALLGGSLHEWLTPVRKETEVLPRAECLLGGL